VIEEGKGVGVIFLWIEYGRYIQMYTCQSLAQSGAASINFNSRCRPDCSDISASEAWKAALGVCDWD
jgi:hypothetical protein